jgi:sigma-B regulation protein RsbU (phosphoserine phosphatase)
MEVIDLTRDERARAYTDLVRQMSVIRDPAALLLTYAKATWRDRPTDLYVSLSVRGLEPGEYKITRVVEPARLIADDAPAVSNPWRDWDLLPVHRGGLLGSLIQTPVPKAVLGLDVRDDPALGDRLAGMGSCSAMPLFDRGEALNWAFFFRRDPRGFRPEELVDNIVTGNLVGAATRALVAMNRADALTARLRSQLDEVARVQQALLPRRIPDIPGLRIATSFLTSDQAGGDYYDFFRLPDGRWGILIADVSGHGAAAATVMAMLRAVLHAYERRDTSPHAVLDYANEQLLRASLEGSFVTAFYAVYDPAAASLTYSRCGHTPPRLKSGATGEVRAIEDAAALPLGIFEDLRPACASIVLAPHDTIVLYTDGITEAFNAQREMFGTARLDEALTACSGDPECTVDSLHGALYRHTGSRTRADDQTIVALRFLGTGAA